MLCFPSFYCVGFLQDFVVAVCNSRIWIFGSGFGENGG